MGIFQEAAIIAGDLVTQPIRKALAEKLTGYNFKIIRKDENDSYVHPTKPKIVYSHKVTWELESLGKSKQDKPKYRY